MTPRQHEALMFVHRYKRIRHGISPTYEEIGAGIGLVHKSNVHRLMSALKDQGYITWIHGRARCIEILRMPEPSEVPPSELSELRKRVEDLERQMTDLLAPNVIPLHGSIR